MFAFHEIWGSQPSAGDKIEAAIHIEIGIDREDYMNHVEELSRIPGPKKDGYWVSAAGIERGFKVFS